jgi:hypothetical protein
MAPKTSTTEKVYDDVLTAIEATRGSFVQTKDRNSIPLYWRVGKCIRDSVRRDPHSETAKRLTKTVAEKLKPLYGKEFSNENLTKMVELSAQFTDYEMVTTLSKQLTWDHFETLIAIDDDIKRDFYAWMTLAKGWSPKALRSRIKADFFEKTPASKKPPDENDEEFAKTLTSHAEQLWSFLGLGGEK